MDENKIYDVENFEDANNMKEGFEDEARKESILLQENIGFNNYGNNMKDKKKMGSGFKIVAISLVTGLLGGLIGASGIYYSMKGSNTTQSYKNITPNPQSFTISDKALTKSEAFERVAPAVVVVSVSGVKDYSGIIPRETEGIGSGFIINEDGYILTNYHVIKGAQEVSVTLSNGAEAKAKVINYDENQDIAMIKINDENIKVPAAVELGDSDALRPGEEVLAIGTPLSKEFNQTVTGGLISAVNRTVETIDGVKLNLIQTDTPINPGNSGGPLINTKGEVVGINTLKMSGGAEGIGFSIPINEIKDRIESLSKPILNLGVSIREIDEKLSKEHDMEEGLYVIETVEFSPAEKAGIKGGDLIVKFDGKRIKTFNELKAIRDTKSEGDTISVEVIRGEENKVFEVKLEAKE